MSLPGLCRKQSTNNMLNTSKAYQPVGDNSYVTACWVKNSTHSFPSQSLNWWLHIPDFGDESCRGGDNFS